MHSGQCYTERKMLPADTDQPTRRDRKKLATRRALQWAALDLVTERGLAHVTVEEIAAAADVSPRTFFNYFSSKEAAVVGEDPDRLDDIRAALLSRPAGEPAFDAVRAVLTAQMAEIVVDAADGADGADGSWSDPTEWMRRMKAVHADPHLRAAFIAHMAAFERVVAEAVATRLGVDAAVDPYPALLAASAMAACRVSMMYRSKLGLIGRSETVTDAAFSELASGLAGTCGLAAALAESGATEGAAPSTERGDIE